MSKRSLRTHDGDGTERARITDSEIRIGQTSSYIGPAQIYSVVSKTEIAYFNMINDQGGINGRKVKVLSLDDGYVPAKTLEH